MISSLTLEGTRDAETELKVTIKAFVILREETSILVSPAMWPVILVGIRALLATTSNPGLTSLQGMKNQQRQQPTKPPQQYL